MNIEKIFDDFVSGYDINNTKIKLKIEHSKRVMENGMKICETLNNMTQNEINLVKIICLFHDVGRFEQIKYFNTFDDSKSFDHAGKSVEILFDQKLIQDLSINYEQSEIIKTSIYYHNKYDIPDYLDGPTKFFCSIIRDADKIDILYLYAKEMSKNININDNPNALLYEEFKKFKSIKNDLVNNETDKLLLVLAFIFDLHYKYSLVQIKDNKYIDTIINNINYKDDNYKNIFIKINMVLNEYINRKLGENDVREEI